MVVNKACGRKCSGISKRKQGRFKIVKKSVLGPVSWVSKKLGIYISIQAQLAEAALSRMLRFH